MSTAKQVSLKTLVSQLTTLSKKISKYKSVQEKPQGLKSLEVALRELTKVAWEEAINSSTKLREDKSSVAKAVEKPKDKVEEKPKLGIPAFANEEKPEPANKTWFASAGKKKS